MPPSGIVVDSVQTKMAELREGKSAVKEWGHTLLVGWTDRSIAFIEQICLANASSGGGVIVVLAEPGKEAMEAELYSTVQGWGGEGEGTLWALNEPDGSFWSLYNACLEFVLFPYGTVFCTLFAPTPPVTPQVSQDDLLGTRVVFRSGSAQNPTDLHRAAAGTARSVVVLAAGDSHAAADAATLRAVLALSTLPSLRGHVVVEVLDKVREVSPFARRGCSLRVRRGLRRSRLHCSALSRSAAQLEK
jgi:hypothetical protein